MSRHLPPFDPNMDFKASANMRFAGYAIVKGTPIDKSLLSDEERDRKLKLLYENHRIEPATEEEAAALTPEQRGELSEEQKARVAELVAQNDRSDLDTLAEAVNVAEPGKLPNKEAVATAIVRAEASAQG